MSDYIQQLNDKLKAAQARVRQGNEIQALKQSAPSLFEIIDLEISLAVNRMTAADPLSYEDYLSNHGQVLGIRRIRGLLEAREAESPAASKEVEAIKDQLEQFEDDRKRQG